MTKSRQLGIIVGCSGANYPTNWVSSFMEGFFSTGCAFSPETTHSIRERERAERSVATHGAVPKTVYLSIYFVLCMQPSSFLTWSRHQKEDVRGTCLFRKPWGAAIRSACQITITIPWANLETFGVKFFFLHRHGKLFLRHGFESWETKLGTDAFHGNKKKNHDWSFNFCFFRASVNVKVAENPK